MFSATIIHLTFLQAPCVTNNSLNRLHGTEILSLSQCCPEDSTVEALKTRVLLYSSKVLGLWWSQKVMWDLVWFSKSYIQEKFQISWSRWLQCFFGFIQLFFITVYGKTVRGVWNRQPYTMTHWMNSLWYIWVLHCPPFLPGNPLLNRRHHTEVAACTVICQLPPYHGHCKQHWTSFAIHPSIQLWWTECAANFQSPTLSLVTYCTTKVLEVHSFYQWG